MTRETTICELKPCPLCGDKDDYSPTLGKSYGYVEPGDPEKGTVGNPAAGLKESGRYVECDKCGCCGPIAPTDEEATSLWNTRAPDEAQQATIEGRAAEIEALQAEMARREENERYHCLNYGPCSQMDARAALEASGHDELVEALREAKGLADMAVMSDDQDGSPSEDQRILVALRAKIDAVLAKVPQQ